MIGMGWEWEAGQIVSRESLKKRRLISKWAKLREDSRETLMSKYML